MREKQKATKRSGVLCVCVTVVLCACDLGLVVEREHFLARWIISIKCVSASSHLYQTITETSIPPAASSRNVTRDSVRHERIILLLFFAVRICRLQFIQRKEHAENITRIYTSIYDCTITYDGWYTVVTGHTNTGRIFIPIV